MVRVRNLALIFGIIVGVGFVFVLLFPPAQTLLPFQEYINFQEGEFNLRFDPLSVTGQESFLINCKIRNTINTFDENGVVRQVIFGESPQFSPAIQLSFIIPTSGQPVFGTSTVRTLLSCDPSPLASSGFRPFLVGGSTVTMFDGFNFDKDTLQLKSSSRTITSTTDMNGRQFFELNSVTISSNDLERILKDDFDYTTTIRATTTGTLLFKQCLATNPNCSATDANATWEHTIKANDAFTAFGLIVEGAGFAPLSSQQEIQITTQLDSGGRLNLADDDRPDWKVRLKNYSPQETIPVVKTFWLGNPDPFERNRPEETRTLGILTQTEEGGTFHVKTGSFTIPITKLGQWCFELQPDETGIRNPSKKCLIAYNEDIPEETIDPMMDGAGSTISQGELRIQYEVQTKEQIFKNDITTSGGIPITFDPLSIVGAGTEKNVIFDIFIEPQLFFNEEILKNLNVVQGGSSIDYTGTISTAEREITVPSIDLRPSDSTFTKNPVSIKLPATKITGVELEEILLRSGASTTSPTAGTLTLNIGGQVLLEETGTQAQWRGVLEGAQFNWNFDYVPAGSGGIIDDTAPDDCNSQGGTIVNSVCIIPEDISQCFDANGNEVECNEANDDTVGSGDEVIDDSNNPNTAQCFDAEGKEIICEERVSSDCDINTDPDRCGRGQIQTKNGDPNNDIAGIIPIPTICFGLPFEVCADEGAEAQQPQLPSLNLGIGDVLTEYAIVIGAGIGLILVIAIGIRLAKK